MQTTQQTALLSPDIMKQIVTDIVASVTDPTSEEFNPSLAATLQIWNALKKQQDGNETINAIVDLVRANQIPLHRVFPDKVSRHIEGLGAMLQSQQRGSDSGNGGGYVKDRPTYSTGSSFNR